MSYPPKISEAEWQGMEVLWEESPLTASEVIERLTEKPQWAANTVRTLLARLVQKGALAYDEEGKKYLYRPVFKRKQHVSNESETFLERIFRGTPKALLLHFAQSSKLSRKDIAELQKVLDRAGKSR